MNGQTWAYEQLLCISVNLRGRLPQLELIITLVQLTHSLFGLQSVTVFLNDENVCWHFILLHFWPKPISICVLLPLNNLYTYKVIHTYTRSFILSCRSGPVSKVTSKEQGGWWYNKLLFACWRLFKGWGFAEKSLLFVECFAAKKKNCSFSIQGIIAEWTNGRK